MKRKYVKKMIGTIAAEAAFKAHVEECAQGFCDAKGSGPNTNDSAVYYEDKGKVVSIITFIHYDDLNYLWITTSWTDPAYRRKGLHNKLFDFLCEIGKEIKARHISSLIAAHNKIMLKAAFNQGREAVYFNMRKDLHGKGK